MPPARYSSDTKDMLDKMMSASGLPLSEQRKLRNACAAGPSAQLPPGRRPLPVGRKPKYEDPLRGVAINPSIARSLPGASRRSQQDILAMNGGSLERDQFRGGAPVKDREAHKEALQQTMAFGRELGPPTKARDPPPPLPKAKASQEQELRAAIADEIAERQQFLDSMRGAGRGGEHEATIEAQISERLADLATLDRLEVGS